MRCDFCGVDLDGVRRLAGRVLADDFEMPLGVGWSEGDWVACDICAPLVRAAVEDGAWGALAGFVSGGARYDGVLALPWLSSLYARLARHARGYEVVPMYCACCADCDGDAGDDVDPDFYCSQGLPWSEHHEVLR